MGGLGLGAHVALKCTDVVLREHASKKGPFGVSSSGNPNPGSYKGRSLEGRE